MPFPPPQFLCGIANTLIVEERSYNVEAMNQEHQNLHSNLNTNQLEIYDAITDSVYNKRGNVFFVYGSGGCGKTFLWRTIIARLRSEMKIVLRLLQHQGLQLFCYQEVEQHIPGSRFH
ncbi:ATP-dependent DNA helicase [Heracleum sosnowskyi]|uniref:ATP-dependent DNA helicase n=1 Tax=Heracleum sosnowskyi TaxID=360622 RepID=A0AAD8MED6_9APIA|nr:ATP-dependent DNA helicase [Heracleum sosnowskyi]